MITAYHWLRCLGDCGVLNLYRERPIRCRCGGPLGYAVFPVEYADDPGFIEDVEHLMEIETDIILELWTEPA